MGLRNFLMLQEYLKDWKKKKKTKSLSQQNKGTYGNQVNRAHEGEAPGELSQGNLVPPRRCGWQALPSALASGLALRNEALLPNKA